MAMRQTFAGFGLEGNFEIAGVTTQTACNVRRYVEILGICRIVGVLMVAVSAGLLARLTWDFLIFCC